MVDKKKRFRRQKVEKISEAAFREAIAGALVHRAWDVEGQIRVFMFDDRIEIISLGGLSADVSEDEFLSGKLSIPRNRILAYVFEGLGLIEKSGTEVSSIRKLYEGSFSQPDFEVSENAVKIVLPVLETDLNLTKDERKVFELLSRRRRKSISEIMPDVDFGKSKTTKLLKEMNRKGIVRIEGRGRGTKYAIR